MAQPMLPFPDAPSHPVRLTHRIAGSRSARRSAKRPDQRLTAALADPGRVLFLDVETTGLSWFYDELTMVGWVLDGKYYTHIAGSDAKQLTDALQRADALV